MPLDPRSVSANRTVPFSVTGLFTQFNTEVTTTDKSATVRKLIQNEIRYRYWLHSSTIHIRDDDRKSIRNTKTTNINPRTSERIG